MSTRLHYTPIRPMSEIELQTFCPSRIISQMARVFGDPPWKLSSDKDRRILRAMSVVLAEEQPNPYQQLVDALDKVGDVEVSY